MIPVMAKPVIPPEPQAPDLASQLPPTITLTPAEVAYYKVVCEAWEDGEYTEEEMADQFPGLSRGAACDWVIKGYTIQGGLTVEDMWNQSAHYAESMRAYVKALKTQINNMYDLSKATQKAMLEVNTKRTESSGGRRWFWQKSAEEAPGIPTGAEPAQ